MQLTYVYPDHITKLLRQIDDSIKSREIEGKKRAKIKQANNFKRRKSDK